MMQDKRRYLSRTNHRKDKPIAPSDEKIGSIAEAGYSIRSREPLKKRDCDPCCWPPRNEAVAASLMDEREAKYDSYLKD